MMKNRVEQQRSKSKGYWMALGNDESIVPCCEAMLTKNEKADIENEIDVSANIPGDECEKIESGTIRVNAAEKWMNELPSISQSNWLTSCWVGICKAVGRRAVDWTTVSGDIEHSILFDWISIRKKKIPRIHAFLNLNRLLSRKKCISVSFFLDRSSCSFNFLLSARDISLPVTRMFVDAFVWSCCACLAI